MYAIRIVSALNLVSHLLRVDAAAVLELHTSLTFLHQLNADHVVSVICSIQAFKLANAVWHMTAYIVKLVEPDCLNLSRFPKNNFLPNHMVV